MNNYTQSVVDCPDKTNKLKISGVGDRKLREFCQLNDISDVSTGYVDTMKVNPYRKVVHTPVECAEYLYDIFTGLDCSKNAGRHSYAPSFNVQIEDPEGNRRWFHFNTSTRADVSNSFSEFFISLGGALTPDEKDKLHKVWDNLDIRYV